MTDTTTAKKTKQSVPQCVLRYCYVPFMLLGIDGAAIALSSPALRRCGCYRC